MCFTTDPAWSGSNFLTALSPSDVSVVVWSSLIYMFFIMWVMAFTVKYGMWTCDCCKAADVNGSRVGPLWLFTFLWEVNKNGALTGTWMKGAVECSLLLLRCLKNKQVSYVTLCLWRCLFAELPRGIPHAERKMWQKRSYSTRWEGKSGALP